MARDPLARADPVALADWLGTVLAVPVHNYEANTPPGPPDSAWPADMVAKHWDVPAEAVHAIADQLGVHARGSLLNAYDVEVFAEQARGRR